MMKKPGIFLIGFLLSGKTFADSLTRVVQATHGPSAGPHIGVAAAVVAFLILYCLLVWCLEIREPPQGNIVASPKPLKGLSPSAMRFISLMTFDSKVFLVAMVNMSVKGFLKITRQHRQYIITKLTDDTSHLSIGEKALSKELFMDDEVVVIDVDNINDLDGARNILYHCLVSEFQNISFSRHTGYFIGALLISYAGFLAMLPPTSTSLFIGAMCVALLANCVILLRVLFRPSQKLGHNIPDWSLSKLHREEKTFYRLALIVLVLVIAMVPAVVYLNWVGTLLFVTMIIVLVVFNHKIKSHTVQGRKIEDQIEGFKLFLKTVKRKQLATLLPDEDQAALFEKYFPYALALDVPEEWAAVFGGKEDYLEFYDEYASRICAIIEKDDENAQGDNGLLPG
jgi:hypothetical protein